MNIQQAEHLIKRLREIEDLLSAAWTGSGSTPFIVDINLKPAQLDEAISLVQAFPLHRLFELAPTLSVWAVLRPLALNYGAATSDVYLHINHFVGTGDSPAARDNLKSRFRRTARNIGLPVSGNSNTNLFFAPLGPALAQHGELARAFVGAAIFLGPPAIEDTASARLWQRRAVIERCPGLTRLQATVAFDKSAYLAGRFEAWRQGARASGETETHLFQAYDHAAKIMGRSRLDIVAPPRLFWADDRLGLEIERSRRPQAIYLGAFSTPVSGGDRLRMAPPWTNEKRWSAGSVAQNIAFAPAAGEVLAFDADSGAFLGRLPADQQGLEVAAERLVVLSAHPFVSPSFGDAIAAQDPNFHVAWITTDETLSFTGRPDVTITKPREDAIWIDGSVLGRDGGHALYACDGMLRLKVDGDVGGRARIIRTRYADNVRYHSISLNDAGEAGMAFTAAHLDQPSDPCEVVFEVLTPGAAGDLDTRVALSKRCWIWPGISTPDEDLTGISIPSNFDDARSAGLRVLDGQLSVDVHADQETPILGLVGQSRVHEFHLAARGEKLWHYRIAENKKAYVSRGSTLLFGNENRHDTLLLRSPDRHATLLVFGRVIHRPFFQRQTIEIGASQLEDTKSGDDRIALKRADGRIDLLARIRHGSDPSQIELSNNAESIQLRFKTPVAFAALRVRIDSVAKSPAETPIEGEYAFERSALDMPPINGIKATRDASSGQICVDLNRADIPAPARVTFFLRGDAGDLVPLRDIRNATVAIGLAGPLPNPTAQHLLALAEFLAEPEPASLGGHFTQTFSPLYEDALRKVGAPRMLGSVKFLLSVNRKDGQPARHDLVAAAPWIFEAPSVAFAGLDPQTGLAPLGQMTKIHAPSPIPSLTGDTPLSDWLERVSNGLGIPPGLNADNLQHGFRALRYRLKETDLHELVGDGLMANTVKLICGAHADGIEQLRSFDTNGGGDQLPVRIAIQLERHARSCANKAAATFVDDIVFRTGLPRREVGQALTLMMRAGIEIFAYFRVLWMHAQKDGRSTS